MHVQGAGLQAPLTAQQAAAVLSSVQQVLVDIQGLTSFTVLGSQVRLARLQSNAVLCPCVICSCAWASAI